MVVNSVSLILLLTDANKCTFLKYPAFLACFVNLVTATTITVSTTTTSSTPGPGECPPPGERNDTVLLPDPTNCSNFFSCSNGVPILMHCPDGLYFNDELDVCDWPQDAGCEDGKYGCVYLVLCSL